MRRIAMVANGIVVEVAVWDGESLWTPGEQFKLVDVTDMPHVQKGMIHLDDAFEEP